MRSIRSDQSATESKRSTQWGRKPTQLTATARIGGGAELLVSYMRLFGIESAPMGTNAGIDLMADSPKTRVSVTIQIKFSRKTKPGRAASGL